MPIRTGNLFKLVFGGPLAGSESWACSIHMMGETPAEPTGLTESSVFVNPIKDWIGRLDSALNASARLAYVKCNEVDKGTGRYVDQSGTDVTFIDPVWPTPGLAGMGSPQLTCAITWHTDVARGRASHGRIYPPSAPFQNGTSFVGPDGLLQANNAQQMANSAQELVSELNAATANLRCVVWSQIGQTGRAVERISVGRVVDTQRRRRANLTESRVFSAANP